MYEILQPTVKPQQTYISAAPHPTLRSWLGDMGSEWCIQNVQLGSGHVVKDKNKSVLPKHGSVRTWYVPPNCHSSWENHD